MRTIYQHAPWRVPGASLARSFALGSYSPVRLGDPGRFFVGEAFAPVGGQVDRALIVVQERVTEPLVDRPIEGVNITRPVCRCKFGKLKRDPAMLGEGCSSPTAGGSGSATYDASGTGSSEIGVGTIALAAAGGVAALWLLGVL